MNNNDIAIQFDHVGKLYKLGVVGTGTLSHDLNRWWKTSILGKEDPYLKIGETNDRSQKGDSEYVWALRDITFDVHQGDVVGIIGKNGAGKSTLLKLLSRVTSPTTGCIRARGRIASLLEVGTGFHPELTGRENIYMNGSIMGMTRHEITRKLDEIVDFAGVARYIDTPVKRYSSGMTVRLGFAVAAFLEPEILVVDEVLAVGDAEFQKKAIGKMQDVSKGEGRTVLFVSHNMDAMLNLCHNGILLENGGVKYMGDINTAVSRYIATGNGSTHFSKKESNKNVFVSEAFFSGTENNKIGMFLFDEQIQINVTIKRNKEIPMELNAVASVCILTERERLVCVNEFPLECLKDKQTLKISLQYPQALLMPGRYLIRIDLHVPNVCYLDKQKPLSFTILDTGSEYIKYNGVDNGIVLIRPSYNMACE